MKISTSLYAVLLGLVTTCQAQIERRLNTDLREKKIGFIYYVNPEYPTFVPIKNQDRNLSIQDFDSKKLMLAYQLNWNQLALDTLSRFVIKKEILNYSQKNVYLSIIPIVLEYTIFKYSKTAKQIAESSTHDYFKFSNKFVSIKSIGGMAIKIENLKVIEMIK